MLETYFNDGNSRFGLCNADCFDIMSKLSKTHFKFDMIFADPPYFLSNGGISVQSGKQVCVNKGKWDKSNGFENDMAFCREWLSLAREVLKPSGTIWICGTYHNIFQVANCLVELGYKILNMITWQKTNPPPNLSCRYFTHSTEFIIWARREEKTPHFYAYELMKEINGGQQMKDVWRMPAIAPWEKVFGKHPTQKPLQLLCRILLASTQKNEWVLDPFTGSSTTGIACTILKRRFLGIDKETDFLEISKKRYEQCMQFGEIDKMAHKIPDLRSLELPEPLFAEKIVQYNTDEEKLF